MLTDMMMTPRRYMSTSTASSKQPESSMLFSGFTLETFKSTVEPSLKLRQQITQVDERRETLITARDDADAVSAKALRRLVHGVIADADEGEDGELYAEMGYMSRAVRKAVQAAGRAKSAEKAAAKAREKEEEEVLE
jgi:hypothetical protein